MLVLYPNTGIRQLGYSKIFGLAVRTKQVQLTAQAGTQQRPLGNPAPVQVHVMASRRRPVVRQLETIAAAIVTLAKPAVKFGFSQLDGIAFVNEPLAKVIHDGRQQAGRSAQAKAIDGAD